MDEENNPNYLYYANERRLYSYYYSDYLCHFYVMEEDGPLDGDDLIGEADLSIGSNPPPQYAFVVGAWNGAALGAGLTIKADWYWW